MPFFIVVSFFRLLITVEMDQFGMEASGDVDWKIMNS